MVTGKILSDNLEPFLTTLGWLIGYTYGDSDWNEIRNDLLDGGGGCYEFIGNQTIAFEVSLDDPTEKMSLTIEAPEELSSQIELAIAIFQNFRLRKR